MPPSSVCNFGYSTGSWRIEGGFGKGEMYRPNLMDCKIKYIPPFFLLPYPLPHLCEIVGENETPWRKKGSIFTSLIWGKGFVDDNFTAQVEPSTKNANVSQERRALIKMQEA